MLEINIFLSQTNQMKAAFLPTGESAHERASKGQRVPAVLLDV